MSSLSSSITLVKKARRPAPKVRTGCVTCKLRRVKCGEEKPWCVRCTSTGRKCGGYAQSANDYRSEVFAVERTSALRHGPSAFQILSDDNVRHLEFYHYCTGPTISSKFDRDFWSRISLQMAQAEPCVGHALIALSHLSRTETGSLKSARSRLVAAPKQKILLFHYNKAVSSLVQRISEPSYTAEIGLVACILFIAIEFLRGNHETAFAHFESGLKIISTLKRSWPKSSANSSGPSVVEDLVLPMFSRIMGTAIIYGVPTEPALLTSLEIQERPFTSMLEAQLSSYNIRNMAMNFLRNIGPKLMKSRPTSEEDLQEQEDRPEFHHAWFHAMKELGPVTEEDLQHKQEILESHRAWLRALEEFESTTTLSKEDVITANSLKAGSYCMYIITACAMDMHQSAFDQHLDGFKALINHARIVLDSIESISPNSPTANFSFEVSIIPYLYHAACRCRCPITRREALSLLERNPPREGLWDAQQHAAVAKRIIEIEENEVDPVTGWPVERARIWSTIINGNMDGDGRFPVYFAVGLWGEGRGVPPLPKNMALSGSPQGRMWKEWFVL